MIRTAQDYRDVTFDYLAACAAEGAIYVELTASPDHAAAAGLSYRDMVAGIAEGIDEAREATGIESRILITAVRNLGPERAEAIAATAGRRAAPLRHRLRPRRRRGRLPARAVRARVRDRRTTRASGSPSTRASGRGRRASARRSTLPVPVDAARPRRARRRGSRRSSPSSPRAARCSRCARRPTSSSARTPSYAEHPFPVLRAAGVRLTLGSDDPPYWGASVGGEYAVAAREWGLDDAALVALTETAVRGRLRPRGAEKRPAHADIRRRAAEASATLNPLWRGFHAVVRGVFEREWEGSAATGRCSGRAVPRARRLWQRRQRRLVLVLVVVARAPPAATRAPRRSRSAW